MNGSSDSSSSSSDESDDTTASWTTAKRIKSARFGFLIDDGLGDTGVEIRVCSQLEDDVENIYQQKSTSVVLLLVYILYIIFQLRTHSYLYASIPQAIIDEESKPGVLAEFMNGSSDSSSSSSDRS
jgi:Ca2+/H+ antiporter